METDSRALEGEGARPFCRGYPVWRPEDILCVLSRDELRGCPGVLWLLQGIMGCIRPSDPPPRTIPVTQAWDCLVRDQPYVAWAWTQGQQQPLGSGELCSVGSLPLGLGVSKQGSQT